MRIHLAALLVMAALALSACGGGGSSVAGDSASDAFFNSVAAFLAIPVETADAADADGLDSTAAAATSDTAEPVAI